jgi:hypothetical protein
MLRFQAYPLGFDTTGRISSIWIDLCYKYEYQYYGINTLFSQSHANLGRSSK